MTSFRDSPKEIETALPTVCFFHWRYHIFLRCSRITLNFLIISDSFSSGNESQSFHSMKINKACKSSTCSEAEILHFYCFYYATSCSVSMCARESVEHYVNPQPTLSIAAALRIALKHGFTSYENSILIKLNFQKKVSPLKELLRDIRPLDTLRNQKLEVNLLLFRNDDFTLNFSLCFLVFNYFLGNYRETRTWCNFHLAPNPALSQPNTPNTVWQSSHATNS